MSETKKPKPWPRGSWHGRNIRILTWIRRIEVGILVGGMIFVLVGRAWWGMLAALALLGAFRFVLWATTVMSCPHCDAMLWSLSRHVEEIKYCPYCGRRLEGGSRRID